MFFLQVLSTKVFLAAPLDPSCVLAFFQLRWDSKLLLTKDHVPQYLPDFLSILAFKATCVSWVIFHLGIFHSSDPVSSSSYQQNRAEQVSPRLDLYFTLGQECLCAKGL